MPSSSDVWTVTGHRLDALIATLLGELNVDGSLLRRFCEEGLSQLQVAGIAVRLTGREEQELVVAASDDQAQGLQTLELTLGEGPGVDAEREGGPVLVSDLADPRRTARWPLYRSTAVEGPWPAQFAFPLQIGTIRLGVMTVYRDHPGPLEQQALADALVFAEAATLLLLHLQDVSGDGRAPSVDLHADVDLAFAATAEVHQATGMISVQAGVGMAEALLLLRGRAFGTGRSASDVARDVVAGRLSFRPEEGS
jgi:hypothetical protein